MNKLKAYKNELVKEIEEIDKKIREREMAADKFIEKWIKYKHKNPVDTILIMERSKNFISYSRTYANIVTYVTITPKNVCYKRMYSIIEKVGNCQKTLDIINKIADRCENTDYLDNLPKAYTFLLSSPFCRDITKIIATKILFFKN